MSLLVPSAVANEMEEMDRLSSQMLLKRREARCLKPFQLEKTPLLYEAQRSPDVRNLPAGVQLRVIRRTGYHHQEPQRTVDSEWQYGPWQTDVPGDRRLSRKDDETPKCRMIEVFPRQVSQFGHFNQPEPQPQAGQRPAIDLVQARSEAVTHRLPKDRLEKLGTEFLSGLHFGRVKAARTEARPTNLQNEVLKFELGEGLNEVNRGLTGRRVYHACMVAVFSQARDLKIEICVVRAGNVHVIIRMGVRRTPRRTNNASSLEG